MKRHAGAVLLFLALPAAASAQAVAALNPLYQDIKRNLIESAEQMPEADYSFKPTPEVRSFGQIIGHVANSSYAICATAKGEKSPNTEDFEKTTSKAALVAAIKAGLAYCDDAFTWADAKFTGSAELFGMNLTRMGWLMLEVTHDNEHYGNLVTYFRLKGMIPPSSKRS
jgi:uncharacterized damage-inducible protein DinB